MSLCLPRCFASSVPLALLLPAFGCTTKTDGGDTFDTADADTDTDADADSDADTDTDTDTDLCVATGFSVTADDFALPANFDGSAYPYEPLQTSSGTRTCESGSGSYVWSTTDLSGDGKADLVVHYDTCGAETGIASTRWRIARSDGTGLGSFEDWTLPSAFSSSDYASSALNAAAGSRTCPDGSAYVWALRDLTGDDKPDLVVPFDTCGTTAGVGTTLWLVYENTGTGFAETATDWPLPPAMSVAPYPSAALNNLTGTRTYGDCSYVWTLRDTNADGLDDLVLPYDSCASEGGVGELGWTVWVNNAPLGFAAYPQAYTLPELGEGYPDAPWNNVSGTRTCDNGGSYVWSLASLAGDARPDLVLAYDSCGADDATGSTSWSVYPGEESGFGSAIAYALPPEYSEAPYPDHAFYSLSGTRTCDDGAGYAWATQDLTGDGLDDLIVPYDACGASLEPGSAFWRVYSASGTGFDGAYIGWTLPLAYTSSSYPSAPFNSLAATRTCANGGYYNWETGDKNGDGLNDLLVTVDTCGGDDALASTKWLLYPGECE